MRLAGHSRKRREHHEDAPCDSRMGSYIPSRGSKQAESTKVQSEMSKQRTKHLNENAARTHEIRHRRQPFNPSGEIVILLRCTLSLQSHSPANLPPIHSKHLQPSVHKTWLTFWDALARGELSMACGSQPFGHPETSHARAMGYEVKQAWTGFLDTVALVCFRTRSCSKLKPFLRWSYFFKLHTAAAAAGKTALKSWVE